MSPESGPSAGAVVSDFGNFVPNGWYGIWDPNAFTSDPNDFTVDSTDWGGCYHFLVPDVDATGGLDIELDVTVNPDNVSDRIILVLVDADGTTRVWHLIHDGVGTQTLRKPLTDFFSEDNPGTVPGLDLSQIAQFNIAGSFAHGNPGWVYDVTFHELRLVGGLGNFEARAARICLGTVAGDGDCDGDNDMIDVLLMQQCFGMSAQPVLPMECGQLDLVTKGVLDDQDFLAFEPLIDGP